MKLYRSNILDTDFLRIIQDKKFTIVNWNLSDPFTGFESNIDNLVPHSLFRKQTKCTRKPFRKFYASFMIHMREYQLKIHRMYHIRNIPLFHLLCDQSTSLIANVNKLFKFSYEFLCRKYRL